MAHYCSLVAQNTAGYCRKHNIAKKKEVSEEAALKELANLERDRRELGRQEMDMQHLELMQDITAVTHVAGFEGYLGRATSLIEGVRDFNSIKNNPFACLVLVSVIGELLKQLI